MTHSVYAPGKGGGATRIGSIKSVKCILFQCQDGSIYGLPLKYVAEARAKYYAEKDKDTTFESEVEYVMKDPYEGIDWFRNNQNPEDFTGKYQLIKPADEKTVEELISEAEASMGYRDVFVPKEEE